MQLSLKMFSRRNRRPRISGVYQSKQEEREDGEEAREDGDEACAATAAGAAPAPKAASEQAPGQAPELASALAPASNQQGEEPSKLRGEAPGRRKERSELQDRLKWLESERVRLLQMSRNTSTRSLRPMQALRKDKENSQSQEPAAGQDKPPAKKAAEKESEAKSEVESEVEVKAEEGNWALKEFSVVIFPVVGSKDAAADRATVRMFEAVTGLRVEEAPLETPPSAARAPLAPEVDEEEEEEEDNNNGAEESAPSQATQLVVREFIRDESGRAGQIEASGHVSVDDIVYQLSGRPVTNLAELAEATGELLAAKPLEEIRVDFRRKYRTELRATKSMTSAQLLEVVDKLEAELQFARAEYARLDIGALESLQQALEDANAEGERLKAEVERLRKSDEFEYIRDRELLQRFEAKEAECRRLYNALIDLKGAIRVFVRVRPAGVRGSDIGLQEPSGDRLVLQHPAERRILVSDLENSDVPERRFEFDTVFSSRATQRQVFGEVEPLVQSVVDGFNSCVFAYGQTGSGKTYTMDGPVNNRGVYYRASESLFNAISKRQAELPESENIEFTVKASVLEIYQERVRDLLNPQLAERSAAEAAIAKARGPEAASPDAVQYEGNEWDRGDPLQPYSLEIMQHPRTGYVYVQGAIEQEAGSAEELQEIIERGKRHRVVGVTDLNSRSSRSHLVLIVSVEAKHYAGSGLHPHSVTRSKLQLIDLAGSERAKNVQGAARLKETGFINKSLSALADVMHALQSNETKHVPFRNSKLTSLLRDSLGGKAKTLVMIQVSPLRRHLNETVRTLEFAHRVSRIRLGVAAAAAAAAAADTAPPADMEHQKKVQRLKRDHLELEGELKTTKQRLLAAREALEKERKERMAMDGQWRHRQQQHEEARERWEAEKAQLETTLQFLRKEHSQALRGLQQSKKEQHEKDTKRLNHETALAQKEVERLRDRNTALRRESQEVKDRLAAAEQQIRLQQAQLYQQAARAEEAETPQWQGVRSRTPARSTPARSTPGSTSRRPASRGAQPSPAAKQETTPIHHFSPVAMAKPSRKTLAGNNTPAK